MKRTQAFRWMREAHYLWSEHYDTITKINLI